MKKIKHLEIDDKGFVYHWSDVVSCMKCGKTVEVEFNAHTKELKPKNWKMVFSGSFEPLQWLCETCELEQLNLQEVRKFG